MGSVRKTEIQNAASTIFHNGCLSRVKVYRDNNAQETMAEYPAKTSLIYLTNDKLVQ